MLSRKRLTSKKKANFRGMDFPIPTEATPGSPLKTPLPDFDVVIPIKELPKKKLDLELMARAKPAVAVCPQCYEKYYLYTIVPRLITEKIEATCDFCGELKSDCQKRGR